MLIFRVRAGALPLLLALLAGCAAAQPSVGQTAPVSVTPVSPQPPPGWVEPPAYTYVLTAGCTRGFYEARYRVVVKDGAVVSVAGLDEQAKNHADYPVPTLSELATWAQDQLSDGRPIRYDRDAVDGHPTAAGFDTGVMATDGGECFSVADYRPE